MYQKISTIVHMFSIYKKHTIAIIVTNKFINQKLVVIENGKCSFHFYDQVDFVVQNIIDLFFHVTRKWVRKNFMLLTLDKLWVSLAWWFFMVLQILLLQGILTFMLIYTTDLYISNYIIQKFKNVTKNVNINIISFTNLKIINNIPFTYYL